jgi:hypothetical protein
VKFVRAASIEEVLRATPDDPATREVTRRHAPYAVWSADHVDIGNIGAQLPAETRTIGIHLNSDNTGPIVFLYPHWMRWIRSGESLAARDAESHEYFLSELETDRGFETRPIILGDRMGIHDGKHRLFAAFEFLRKDAKEKLFEVYWDRAA